MFCRAKVSGPNTYIQIVENHRDGKKVRQRVIATLGRLDHLQKTGALERFLQSACRFSEQLMVLAAQPGSGDGEDGAEVPRNAPDRTPPAPPAAPARACPPEPAASCAPTQGRARPERLSSPPARRDRGQENFGCGPPPEPPRSTTRSCRRETGADQLAWPDM